MGKASSSISKCGVRASRISFPRTVILTFETMTDAPCVLLAHLDSLPCFCLRDTVSEAMSRVKTFQNVERTYPSHQELTTSSRDDIRTIVSSTIHHQFTEVHIVRIGQAGRLISRYRTDRWLDWDTT